MVNADFVTKKIKNNLNKGNIIWSSPSNIALVKYWGKKDQQIPENPSISFTLNACKTITELSYTKKENNSDSFSFEVFLDEKPKPDFHPKIEVFFNRIEAYLPFLKDFHFTIKTRNTFPHSSGIASSASGMSALALCLMSIEKELNPHLSEQDFIKKASFLARLGSGSASRSLEGDLVVWGNHDDIEGSSDLFAIKYPDQVHEVFKNYHDTILLVDKGEKQVSSTVGHNLMHGHSFSKQRFDQAVTNISKLKTILKSGDLNAFIALVESEALTLHAMMMTSLPYFILMKPNTLKIINKIWSFRQQTGLPISFTLDAGANVHVLYPENGHYICDRIGFGAKQL